MMENVLRAGVIGLGNMGRHHARNYATSQNSRLEVVCDSDENGFERTKELFKKKGITYDAREHLNYRDIKTGDLDIVSIVTPTPTHYDCARYFLENGTHVLLEKPITDDAEKARELIRVSEQNGTNLMVGHIERFNPAVVGLKKLIDNGTLGEINQVYVFRCGPFPPQIKEDILIDFGIHDLDLMNQFFGMPTGIPYARINSVLGARNEDTFNAVIEYGNTQAHLTTSWSVPVRLRRIEVFGTGGYARMYFTDQILFYYKSRYTKEREWEDFGDFKIIFAHDSEKIEVPITTDEPLRLELEAFMESVRNGTKVPVSGQEGLNALLVAEELKRRALRK